MAAALLLSVAGAAGSAVFAGHTAGHGRGGRSRAGWQRSGRWPAP